MKYEDIKKYNNVKEVLNAKLPGPLTKMTENEYKSLSNQGYIKVGDLAPEHKDHVGRIWHRINCDIPGLSNEVMEQLKYFISTHFYNQALETIKKLKKEFGSISKLQKKVEKIVKDLNLRDDEIKELKLKVGRIK